MRSMFSSISALRAHQTRMDVIGDNIANVNTVGFKSSRVTFASVFASVIKAASAPDTTSGRGGFNPMQIGLGVNVASTDLNMARGSLQRTDNLTDLAIEGDGFFVVGGDGKAPRFTRAGNFSLNKEGYLITANGLYVLGYAYDPKTDQISKKLDKINITNYNPMGAEPTSKIVFGGNLNNEFDIGKILLSKTGIKIYGTYNGESDINLTVRYDGSIYEYSIDGGRSFIKINWDPDGKFNLNGLTLEKPTVVTRVPEDTVELKQYKNFNSNPVSLTNTGITVTGNYYGSDGATQLSVKYDSANKKYMYKTDRDSNWIEITQWDGNKAVLSNGLTLEKKAVDPNSDAEDNLVLTEAKTFNNETLKDTGIILNGSLEGYDTLKIYFDGKNYKYSTDGGKNYTTIDWNPSNQYIIPGNNNTQLTLTKPSQNPEMPVDTIYLQKSLPFTISDYNVLKQVSPNDIYSTSFKIFDSQGSEHTLQLMFVKLGVNQWEWIVDGMRGSDGKYIDERLYQNTDPEKSNKFIAYGLLEFNNDGSIKSDSLKVLGNYEDNYTANPEKKFTIKLGDGTERDVKNIVFDLFDPDKLFDLSKITQYNGNNELKILSVDGYTAGDLMGFEIDPAGFINGIYSNGHRQKIAQIALATFANPAGLQRIGDNLYINTANSGNPEIGTPGSGSRGTIAQGMLEMSNVDLAREFTDMIVTQRGYQANARVITASDELLQDLVNIKR